ncbi:hypothetical protein PHMEG_00030747 [Phytophthora megakarya]|uniref:Uncharacterized protein n=1 Tax=Phytophthora megakarya TaxID=4795 RepID=A0A225UZL7_9STRA|nr:hypothetical protein PHMEG_00030747 [Phytophthora megakarya]
MPSWAGNIVGSVVADVTHLQLPLRVLMKTTKVKKALRVDHSVKFCKKLKVRPRGPGKRESMRDTKMLLLLQNEIGQIVGRRLTRSENNDETRECLEHVKDSFPDEGEVDPCYVISDNANSVRAMVQDVLGASVGVLQDPFHVIQRFTEKVKDKPVRKYLAKQLHEAIYDIDGQLRVPSKITVRVEATSDAVLPKDVGCSDLEWHGTLNNNLQQIRRGDLEVATNTNNEGGGKSVRVLSTSQLEGFHSALKKLLARSVSAEVGLRILAVFIVRHNLKVGARYGRNPSLQHADLFTLAQTASCCRGAPPESLELEYVSNLMSFPLARPQYRSTTDHDFGFEEWGQLFDSVKIDTNALELNLRRSHHHSNTIEELLAKQAVFSTTRAEFFNSLCLIELDYEAAIGFSSEELALLRQLRSEQVRAGQSWADCALVTTIMYNIAVASNLNSQLK